MSDDPPTIEDPPPAPRFGGPAETLIILALGLNAWLVIVLIPAFPLGFGEPSETALSVLPLVVLTIGAVGVGLGERWASHGLLAVFPPAIGAAIAARPEVILRDGFDPITLSLAVASLGAFIARMAVLASTSVEGKPTTVHPSADKEPVEEPPARRWLRRGLLTATGLGAYAIAVLAPGWAEHRERVDRWDESALDGAVLTAIVAALLATLALGAIVGPSLRAERRRSRQRRDGRRRALIALAVAGVAAVCWTVLSYFDSAP